MKKLILGLAAISAVTFVSCEKKEAVAVNDAEDVAVSTEEAVKYNVDTDASTVTWRGFKIYEGENEEQGHYGTMKLKNGEVSVENGAIVSGTFVIDPSSITSEDLAESPEDKAKLEGHLKSADFLDVEKYQESTFVITNVASIDGEYNTEVSGNLKLREDEKNITFKANVKEEGDALTLDSEEFTINRQDFGVDFKGAGGAVIKDNVVLKVNIVAKK